MAVVSILKVSILILSMNVIVTLQAPLQLRNKYTCLPRNPKNHKYDYYSKNDWDSCTETGNKSLRYDDAEMQSHIIHSLGLPHFRLNNDETRCFSVDTYDTSSSSSACPAFCKINNVKNFNQKFLVCDDNTVSDLKVIPHTGNAVLIKSPKYNCNNETYPKGFMCIYSVRMSCGSNGLVVSQYDMNLLENDFIQVIDTNAYSPITGDSWPADQPQRYQSSNLKVVFWSDRDETQGKGFSLQFSCTSPATEEVPSLEPGSGEGDEILTLTQ